MDAGYFLRPCFYYPYFFKCEAKKGFGDNIPERVFGQQP